MRHYYEQKMLNNCQIWLVWHTDIWIIKDIFSIQFHKYKKRFPEAHNKYLIINQQLPNLSFRVCYCQSKSKGKHMYYMITCVFKKVFFLLPFTSQHDLIFHIQVSWKSIRINVASSIFNPNGSILINYGC